MWKWWVVIECVGPCHTEIASTNGTTIATSTTHDSSSYPLRNAQPANTAAASFAKFVGRPQPASEQPKAMSAETTVAATSGCQPSVLSGSASSTSSSTPGMTAAETIATAGHRP